LQFIVLQHIAATLHVLLSTVRRSTDARRPTVQGFWHLQHMRPSANIICKTRLPRVGRIQHWRVSTQYHSLSFNGAGIF